MSRREGTRLRRVAVIALVVFLLSLASSAAAQAPERVARRAIASEVFVPEDVDNRDIRVATLSVETERYLVGGLWLRGALGLVFTEGVLRPDDGPQGVEREAEGVGLGGGGFLRWRPVRVRRLAPFVEGGFGALFTTEAFPPGGTVWNFSQRYGLGIDVQITARLELAVAYRHVHFSNGKGLGSQNPSYNGDGVMLAISW